MKTEAESTAIWAFTPSRNTPEELEAILVQRRQLLDDAVERVRESALSDHKHHQLFVGPRGSGKTFLVSLIVHRVLQAGDHSDRLRVAWLNEDETCTTFLEFLIKIHTALGHRYPKEFPTGALAPAYEMPPKSALALVGRVLLEALGNRTLLAAVENLDALFETLGNKGQHELRAFIQEHPRLAIVATAQRLIEDLSSRSKPFFGFFQTEYLKPLNLVEATELLQNIARLNRKEDVVEFLNTRRGKARIRALHHLSGGNHRIYIVLSHFITRNSIDALVEPFMRMVDELTPYYQERVRWLPPLQRRIVEMLCRCEGPVPVKELAKHLFSSQQTISRQLQELREKGYVEANARGREMLYEISEPLMRICVEVKDNSIPRPLRLLVDFLRAWYDESELTHRLHLSEPVCRERAYLESAMQRNRDQGNLRKQLMIEDFRAIFQPSFDSEDVATLMERLEALPESLLLVVQCWEEGRDDEAVEELQTALDQESDSRKREALLQSAIGVLFEKAKRFFLKDDFPAAAACLSRVIDLQGAPMDLVAHGLANRGECHAGAGDVEAAQADYRRVIEMPSAPVSTVARALFDLGFLHKRAGDLEAAKADFTRVIEMPGAPVTRVAGALFMRGRCLDQGGDREAAKADFTRVIEMPGAPLGSVPWALVCRGLGYQQAGNEDAAKADFTRVIDLPGAPTDQVAHALVNRGLGHERAGNAEAAKADYTSLIQMRDAPTHLVAQALVNRGVCLQQTGNAGAAMADYTRVIEMSDVPVEEVAMALIYQSSCSVETGEIDAARTDLKRLGNLPGLPASLEVSAGHLLTILHWVDGDWPTGFDSLDFALKRGSMANPKSFGLSEDLVAALFAAGLSPEGRRAHVAEMVRTYARHQALPTLGEGLVRHLGRLFQSGSPFPSTDNLGQWLEAWEQGAATEPDFHLSLRLLRVGVAFLKTGGKDSTVLLDLASVERSILRQALGLEEAD